MPVIILLPVLETVFVAFAATLTVRLTNDLYDRVTKK